MMGVKQCTEACFAADGKMLPSCMAVAAFCSVLWDGRGDTCAVQWYVRRIKCHVNVKLEAAPQHYFSSKRWLCLFTRLHHP